MTDQYEYWRNALAGKNPPMHEGCPEVGFYRKRNTPFNDQPRADDPVAIYPDENGKLIALQGPQNRSKVVDANDIWTWVADKPVSYEDYQAAFERNQWDKAIEGLEQPAGAGHNNPPEDPFEAFKEQADAAIKLAEQAMSQDIKTREDADRFANIKDRLHQIWSEGEEDRKAEKKPHDDAGKAVQKKWAPALTEVEQIKKKLIGRIGTWIEAEEQRIAKEQLEAAKAAEEAGEDLPVQTSQPVQIGGAVSGRKTSMRSRKSAVIEDPVKFATFLLDSKTPNSDVMAALQKCANKIVANGGQAPGLESEKKRNAA